MFMNVPCMYEHGTETYVHLHSHTSLLIRPDRPCDACKQAQLLQSSLLPFIRMDSVGWTCTVSCNVYTLYIRVRTMYIHVHTLYMGSTYGMYIPLWYILLCSCMNCSCVMYVQFINNAMVQDSAFLYRQCSYRDIHAKNGYARWGHVQCHDMYIHGTYAYVQCTDTYMQCT